MENKECIISKIIKTRVTRRDLFSSIILLLVFMGEAVVIMLFQGKHEMLAMKLILCIVAIIAIVWFISYCSGERYGIHSVIMTNLLANAIVPRGLGVLYLSFFVIHVGWLSNIVLSLFVSGEDLFIKYVWTAVVCLLGLLLLIAFFPEGRYRKKGKSKVFISGFPFIESARVSLSPVVRILQEMNDDDNECEMIILLSDYYSEKNKIETLNNIREEIKKYYCKVNGSIPNNVDVDKTNIRVLLDGLIKTVIEKEFTLKKWMNNLTITFIEDANYDDYNDCFHKIQNIVNRRNDASHLLYFNMTPGPSLMSSLMTLLAFDGMSRLFYYQDKCGSDLSTVPEIEKRSYLHEVEKKDIPLKSILSQALDSIMYSHSRN